MLKFEGNELSIWAITVLFELWYEVRGRGSIWFRNKVDTLRSGCHYEQNLWRACLHLAVAWNGGSCKPAASCKGDRPCGSCCRRGLPRLGRLLRGLVHFIFGTELRLRQLQLKIISRAGTAISDEPHRTARSHFDQNSPRPIPLSNVRRMSYL